MTSDITPDILPHDIVEFDDGYGGRLTGEVTQVLGGGNLFIRYGRGNRTLGIFNIAKHNITLVCEWCEKAKPDVTPTEDPYVADVYNTPGERMVSCADCYQKRRDDI